MSHFYCLIENARCEVRLGIHEHECHGPQEILVSVRMNFALPALRGVQQIGDTVDYEPLRNLIRSWSQRSQTSLIEALLEELVTHCFKDQRVDQVEARIRKTTIFAEVEEVGVGVNTTRPDWFAVPLRGCNTAE